MKRCQDDLLDTTNSVWRLAVRSIQLLRIENSLRKAKRSASRTPPQRDEYCFIDLAITPSALLSFELDYSCLGHLFALELMHAS
jgi:hypothetical protein